MAATVHASKHRWKRPSDIVLVLLAAPVVVPTVILIAVIIRLGMGAPVFYRDERAGLHGAPFALVKFRTMTPGTGADSTRTTLLGRWLRATSLDELPQLWNVLLGHMSLVGPRPLPIRYVERYDAHQVRRLTVRPGLTGLAQVNGRNLTTWDERFAFDLEYVQTVSVRKDISILCGTVAGVLRPRGVTARDGEAMPEFWGSATGQPPID